MTAELIGRTIERRRLADALADPEISRIRIAGPSGSGKTALAAAALAGAASSGALTGWGKYTEGETRSAFGPIMAALSQVVGRALDQLYEPKSGLTSLSAALGGGFANLAQAGLAIEGLAAPAASTSGGRREGAVRVTAAALGLAKWLDGFGCPVAILVDDAFRAPPEARALLTALANRPKSVPWTVVSTVRSQDHKPRLGLFVLGLEPMPFRDRLALLERALGNRDAARSAFEWFGDDKLSTPGNILEAARAIERSEALETAEGRLRIAPARLFQGAGDVLQSVAYRIAALSPAADRIALAAALWGDAAPLDGLGCALEWPRDKLLQPAGELIDAGMAAFADDTLRFTHDQVRAGILNAASQAEQKRLCARMAALLIHAERPDWATTALHFRLIAGLEDVHGVAWRDRFAAGARAARARADAAVASAFAEAAWTLRGPIGPVLSETDRAVLREALHAAGDRNDVAAVKERARLLIDGTSSPADIAEAYELAIYALETAGASEACWQYACEGLARFGVRIPERITRLSLLRGIARWRLRLHGRRRDANTGVDEEADAAIRIAHAAAYPAFERGLPAAMMLALKGVARGRGRAQSSAYWLALDAFLSSALGRFANAAKFGDRAIAGAPGLAFGRAATIYRASYFGSVWHTPQAELRPQCLEIAQRAIAEGDLSTASGAYRNWLVIGWRTAPNLAQLDRDVTEIESVLDWLCSSRLKDTVDNLRRVISDLMEPGAAFRPDRFAPTPTQPTYIFAMRSYLKDWAGGLAAQTEFRRLRQAYAMHPGGAAWRFHECLAHLKTGQRIPRAGLDYLRRIAALNPRDHGARLAIVEAEQLVQAGRPSALSAYARAVEIAQSGHARLLAGLAAELAADAARAFGKTGLGDEYDARAGQIWRDWGARAKERPEPESAHAPAIALARAEASAAAMSDRAKSRLLADVAHELRTPMQGMQSLLDLAADRPEALDLAALRDVLASLRTITDDLTDYGALSSGTAALSRRRTALRLLLESEARVFFGAGRNVEVAIDEAVPAHVAVDGDRVRQVIRNLLSNATKYGGGNIWLRASAEPLEGGRHAITVQVEDDGRGLTDAERLHIFEPFERGPHQGDGRGMGLGLALARRIAERLDGDLTADNRAAGGARFSFSFEAGPDLPAAPAPSDPVHQPLSILLAEDVALNRRAIAVLLRNDGHQVYEVADGLEAVEALARQSFDAALIDLSMPRASGQEVLRAVGAMAGRTPFAIAMTASSDPAIHAEAAAAGARRVLQKPLSLAELREALAPPQGVPPATGAPAETARTEIDLAALAAVATDEIRVRTRELIEALERGDASAAQAHRLAGLAAQFHWPIVADAADRISDRLRIGPADLASPEFIEWMQVLTETMPGGADAGTAPQRSPMP